VESVDGGKDKSERLFEATKFAYAHNPLEGAAPLQTSPSQKTTTTAKTYLLRGGVG